MSLYPTLEDMKVGEMITAQVQSAKPESSSNTINSNSINQQMAISGLYPSLNDFMGFNLATLNSSSNNIVVAPISQENAIGIKRAEVRPGMRKIVLCKDSRGKIGIGVKQINNGLFISVIYADSPASLAGLRFGDQILEINQQLVSGYSTDKAKKLLRKCAPERIEIVVRDRPFERIVTINKDSTGHLGFGLKNGEITTLVKDSSAARNGLLTDHHLIEIDGRCVVGMTDKHIFQIVDMAPRSISLTIMPTILYKHIIKCIGESELKKFQDHSIPEI